MRRHTQHLALIRCAALSLAILLFAGCGTLQVRLGESDGELYPALNTDKAAINYSWSDHYGWSPSRRFPIWQSVLTTLIALVDMPISVASDTLFLPFDCHAMGSRKPIFFLVVDDVGCGVPAATIHTYSENERSRTFDTDPKGLAQIRWNWTLMGHFSVAKPGYYTTTSSSAGHMAVQRNLASSLTNGVYTVRLMRQRNPVPMILVRESIRGVPQTEFPLGYDATVGEPVGSRATGKHASFFIEYKKGLKGYDGDITFPLPGDGILFEGRVPTAYEQQVGYVTKYEAPIEGYQPSLSEAFKRSGTSPNDHCAVAYLRITDTTTGRAMYGKMLGHPMFDGSVSFTYFLNPDGSRNVEYSGKNLLPFRSPHHHWF